MALSSSYQRIHSVLRRSVAPLALPSQLLIKCDTPEAAMMRHGLSYGRTLNVGSKAVRLHSECVNTDIAPGPNVDVVADAHDLSLSFAPATFDTVALMAMLQYCRDPRRVVEQAAIVLKPGGTLLIDAPFVQPYCEDGKDLWRFTDDGLRELCRNSFDILDVSIAIGAGSALAFATQTAASARKTRSGSKLARLFTNQILWPLRHVLKEPRQCAGAFLLVARKRG